MLSVSDENAVRELTEYLREEADLDDLALLVSLLLSDNCVQVHGDFRGKRKFSDVFRDGRRAPKRADLSATDASAKVTTEGVSKQGEANDIEPS